jgi:hypothetical protein
MRDKKENNQNLSLLLFAYTHYHVITNKERTGKINKK